MPDLLLRVMMQRLRSLELVDLGPRAVTNLLPRARSEIHVISELPQQTIQETTHSSISDETSNSRQPCLAVLLQVGLSSLLALASDFPGLMAKRSPPAWIKSMRTVG